MNRLGVGKHGLGLRQLPFGLVERGLKWPWINFEKKLALLDECSFLVGLSHDVAGDLGPDIGICETVERADPFAINRYIFLLNLHDLDFQRRVRRRSGYVFGAYRSNNQADDE